MGLGQGYCALGSVFLSMLLGFACRTIVFCAKTALSDIVALLGTLSRLGLTYWTSLSIWKKPWKRAPEVTSGWFSARAGCKSAHAGCKSARAGCKLPQGRTKLAWAGPKVVQPGF